MEKDRQSLHIVEEEIQEDWIEDWAAEGVKEIEDYLKTSKHAKFLIFLSEQKKSSPEQ